MKSGSEIQNAPVESSSTATPIAFCITDLDRGGAELAMVQVVTRLDPNQWLPHVYCLTHRGRLADELEQQGVPVTCYELSKWNLLLVVWRLRSALKNTRPAILQTFLYHANIIGRIAGWLAGVPHVCSGIRVAEKRSRFRLWIDRWTDRLVSKHICVSESVAAFSVEVGGLSRSKIEVVANGVDVDRFASAEPAKLAGFGVPEDACVVLSVGRLEPQKAPQVLIDGISPLFPRFEKLHLLMVGTGSLESSLRDQAARLGIADRVHFAGRQDDIAGIMRASSCFVLTSRWEGMPNVVLEAMAAGLPVVTTLVEGVDELIGENRGVGIPVGDVDAVTSAVETVLADLATAKGNAESAQRNVMEHFTWNRCGAAFEALYRKLISGSC
ncbi:MAG: glycosyltransferase [Planctomycetaceae bacterium]